MTETTFSWTENRQLALVGLITQLRCSTIEAGKILGCSKNAVIGRTYRTGIVNPNSLRTARETFNERMTRLDVFPRSGHCVFPHGHVKDADFGFCGERVVSLDRPYCAEHTDKTVLRLTRRENLEKLARFA